MLQNKEEVITINAAEVVVGHQAVQEKKLLVTKEKPINGRKQSLIIQRMHQLNIIWESINVYLQSNFSFIMYHIYVVLISIFYLCMYIHICAAN